MHKMVATLILLLTAGAAYPNQQSPAPRVAPADVRLNPSKPTAYLSFERYEGQEVWLRLHNNSRWAISIRAEEPFSVREPADPEGGLDAFDSATRVEVSPAYEIENYPPERSVQHSGCTFSESWIPPGRSVFFKVAHEQLTGVATLRVHFRYEWEGDGAEPAHYLYFSYHELPQSP